MESDEEYDACAAVIVAAAMIEAEEQQKILALLREEAIWELTIYQLMPLIKQVWCVEGN